MAELLARVLLWHSKSSLAAERLVDWNITSVTATHEMAISRLGTYRLAEYRAGSIIKTTTKLTANHAGHVEFRLCPLASKKDLETEDCFEKYPLRLKDGSTSYKIPGKITGEIEIDLVLPDVKCEQCVLQWTYVTGNSWGICEDGTGALGCGPQETFRTCSDISLS
ncbi:hypothetical protein L798_07358 [Zootermopsis nevadensis]|uniref:Chitin-binding type-4 domain-containing protein n=1 Tax=Zootermopsis nevadensis TaxID=136037 RepID=A0A067R5H7_ZOONE|nr:hypothetical protein L798_07358 [Zootermopsis nevadensis]